jgi:hypothetical protein
MSFMSDHPSSRSDAVIWSVFVGSILVMVAVLSGWDPTFGVVSRAWRHPLLVAVLVAAALCGWLARTLKQRAGGRRPISPFLARAAALTVAGVLVSLVFAQVLGAYLK